MTLTDEEVRDIDALLQWAFMTKPGIPVTGTLNNLWSKTHELLRDKRVPA